MRVGLDISPLTSARTGVGNYCYYLLKHLLRLESGCEFAGFSSGRSRIELGELAGMLPHRHVPVPTRALYAVWSTLRAPKVDSLLGGVDVFHATNYFVPPTKSARRVVTFHDLAFLVAPELCSPKIRRTFSKGIKRFATEADAIIACSESTKADIIRLLGVDASKVTVAYEAVDEDFAPGEDKEKAAAHLAAHHGVRGPFFLFVGTLEPRKNIPTLLRAFASIASDVPHDLVLVGGIGWNAATIFDTIEELGLSQRVVQLGFLNSHDELAAFYSAAEAFVFPTLYEGFGLPILEAMKCGCPVITSNISSAPEVAGDAALCHDPRDAGAFAQSMRNVVEDAQLRETLAARGIEQARRFSWESCARTTIDVYTSVAGQKP